MAKTVIGKVSIVPRGNYAEDKNYIKLDGVKYNGSFFICKKECIGISPDNEGYWMLSAEKGEIGPQGEKPVNGVDYNTEEEKESFQKEVVENATSVVEENIEKIKTEAIKEFDNNASVQMTDFNNNVTQKTTEFNNNATETTEVYNSNAEEKINEFNENYNEKMENLNELESRIAEVEKENEILKAQIPTGKAEGNYIHLTDSSDMNCNISLVGNSQQVIREGYNKLNSENLNLFNENKYLGTLNYSSEGTLDIKSESIYSIVYKSGIIQDAGIYLYNSENVKTQVTSSTITNGVFNVKIIETLENISLGFYLGQTTKTYSSIEQFLKATNLMLLEGDYSSATIPSYEEYGATPSLEIPSKIQSVDSNAAVNINNINFIDTNSLSSSAANGISWTINDDGSISALGTCINYEASMTLRAGKLKEDDYTYKCFGLPDTCKTNIWSVGDITGESIKRFTAQNGVDHNIVVVVPVGETVDFTIRPMLLKGSYTNSSLPPYKQHQSQKVVIPLPQELCKIGDYADTIEKIDGRWKIVKRIKEAILKGNEEVTIAYSTESDTYETFCIQISDITDSWSEDYGLLSNYFKKVIGNDVYNKLEPGICSDNLGRLLICVDILTIEEFKAKLKELYDAGNPVKIYYVSSSEPEYIDLPDETQDILNNIKTYKNISTISVDGIGSLKVIYYKDLETLHANQETRILALENAAINQ